MKKRVLPGPLLVLLFFLSSGQVFAGNDDMIPDISASNLDQIPVLMSWSCKELHHALEEELSQQLEEESRQPVSVTHTWTYPYGSPKAEKYSLTYYILRSDYADCCNFTRLPEYNDDFLVYLQDDRDDRLIVDLVECFDMLADDHGLNEYEEVELMISFVQSFDYVTDEDWKGENVEYPKFPLETLYDRCGDCEDTCILLEALLLEKGYGCCMLLFADHAAVGIYGTYDLPGWYFTKYGRRYYYVETTDVGWGIGEMPDKATYNSARMVFPD